MDRITTQEVSGEKKKGKVRGRLQKDMLGHAGARRRRLQSADEGPVSEFRLRGARRVSRVRTASAAGQSLADLR